MKLLTRESILKKEDLKTERVDVPEWGGYIFVRTLSGEERDTFESDSYVISPEGKTEQVLGGFRARMVALVACNEKGERLFTAADVEALNKKSSSALIRVFDVASKVNGLNVKAVEVEKETIENSPLEDLATS